jgi:hypothetical protein
MLALPLRLISLEGTVESPLAFVFFAFGVLGLEDLRIGRVLDFEDLCFFVGAPSSSSERRCLTITS